MKRNQSGIHPNPSLFFFKNHVKKQRVQRYIKQRRAYAGERKFNEFPYLTVLVNKKFEFVFHSDLLTGYTEIINDY